MEYNLIKSSYLIGSDTIVNYTMVDHLITYISTSLFHITGVVTIIRKYKVLGIKLVK